MTTAPDNILNRVRKLLALANSSNPNEAAVAAAQASKIMDEYRLSSTDIPLELDPMVDDVAHDGGVRGNRSAWRSLLAQVVAGHHGAAVCLYGASIMFAGRKSDVQVAVYMYKYLEREIDRLAKQANLGSKSAGKSYRLGAIQGVASILRATRSAESTGATSTALVLDRAKAASEWKWKDLRVAKNIDYFSSDRTAQYRGYEDGKNIDLHKGLDRGGKPVLQIGA